jgi:hypothetical protein
VRVAVEDEQRLLQVLDTVIGAEAVDKAPRGALSTDAPTWIQRRADALMDVLEAGLAHLQAGREVDAEAAMVNVMCDYDVLVERARGSAELDGGIPVSGEVARRLACDAGLVRIVTRGASEILDVGRVKPRAAPADGRARPRSKRDHDVTRGLGRQPCEGLLPTPLVVVRGARMIRRTP